MVSKISLKGRIGSVSESRNKNGPSTSCRIDVFKNRLLGAGDSRPFSVIIKLVESGETKPQLVLAVAAGRPIATLRGNAGGSLGAAEQLFPRVLNEARQAGQMPNASAKLFRLQN